MQTHHIVIAIGVAAGLIGAGLFVSNTMAQNNRCAQLADNYRTLVTKPITGTVGLLQSQATYEHACGTPQSAAAADAAVIKQQNDEAAAAKKAQDTAAANAAAQQASNQAAAAQQKAQADAQAAQQKAQADAAAEAAAALGPDGRPYGTIAQRNACEKLLQGVDQFTKNAAPLDADYAQAGCADLSGFAPSLSSVIQSQQADQKAKDAANRAQTQADMQALQAQIDARTAQAQAQAQAQAITTASTGH